MSIPSSQRKENRTKFTSLFPFELVNGGLGVELDLTMTSGTSSRVPLVGTGDQVLAVNDGPYTACLIFGDSSIEATTACTRIVPGIPHTLTIPEDATHVAGITKTGTANVQITRGHGN